MGRPLRCAYCGKVIGVYEPMVVQVKGGWRETSLLNEQPEGPIGDCYHPTCLHAALDQRPPPVWPNTDVPR